MGFEHDTPHFPPAASLCPSFCTLHPFPTLFFPVLCSLSTSLPPLPPLNIVHPTFPPATASLQLPSCFLPSTPHFPLLPPYPISFFLIPLSHINFTPSHNSQSHRKQEEESLRAAIALSQAESDEQKKEEEEKEEESGDLLLDLNSSGVVDPWSVPVEPPPSYDAVTGSKAPDPWSTYPATTTQPTQPGNTSLGRVYIISMLHVQYSIKYACSSPV